jgi:transcriptional regulator with XRE-family HTH domain
MSVALSDQTSLADLLREGRKRLGGGDPRGLPQPRMADLLGVSLRQYQRWERGSSRPSARGLERIARTLDAERQDDGTVLLAKQVESLQAELRALRSELDAIRAQRLT